MYQHKFKAMGCPCEILIQSKDMFICKSIINDATIEINRIETKYSRYIKDNFIFNTEYQNYLIQQLKRFGIWV